MTARLAVIVVSHRTRERTLALLDDLDRDPARSEWEVVIVDNDSRDGTDDAVARRPRVRLVRNVPQRGFAAAVNQGVVLTDASLVVTVNPDTRVPVGTMGRLAAALEADPRLAAVGPLIRAPDGRPQQQGLFRPTPRTAAIVLLGLARLPLFEREARRYYGLHEPGAPVEVDQLPGTCIMFRRAALEDVGLLDERFFLYCEDADWCLRARARGWRLHFVRDVAITHEKAASSRGRSRWAIRTYYRSLRTFYAKHEAPRAALAIRSFWYSAAYAKEALALVADALRRRKGLRY